MSDTRLEEFYVLDHPDSGEGPCRWLEFSSRIHELGPDTWKEVMDGTAMLDGPLPMKVMKGRLPADIHGASSLINIYSGRLVDLLLSLGCTLRTHPVVLYDRKDREIIAENLLWVRVDVGAGPADRTRGIHLQFGDFWRRDPELTDAYGLYFDLATWNGADIFMCENSHSIIVTERVAEAVRAAGLVNVKITPVLEHGKESRDYQVEMIKWSRGRGGHAQN